jgi:hypothetical protein
MIIARWKNLRHTLAVLLLGATAALSSAAVQPGIFTADLHKAKGVGYRECHGKTKQPTFVPAARCLECHGPLDALIRKTASVKPQNPHDSPHWGARMECNVCHLQHEKTVSWCNYCHAFGFKVP